MRKIIFLLFAVNIFLNASAQNADELAVKAVLAGQVSAWNKGSIDEFMKSYLLDYLWLLNNFLKSMTEVIVFFISWFE